MKSDTIVEAFHKLKTREDVAQILEIKDTSLRYFLYKRRPENMYSSFSIPKRDGTMRQISAPAKQLKTIQQKLAAILAQVYNPKVCAYGFIPGKNILQNAQQHTQRSLILNIDLKDFFNQIHFGRVRGMLMAKPYSIGTEAATTIAQIACLNGRLPQGAPTSPVITNMICAPLDNALMLLAKSTGCNYTRYADDLSFSTYKSEFSRSLVISDDKGIHLGEDLLNILKKNSFEVNENKISLRPCYTRQEVTGLTVNAFPNVRRSYIKQIRAILHSCEKYGLLAAAKTYIERGYCHNQSILCSSEKQDDHALIEEWFKKVLIGKITYVGQIKGNGNLTYLSFAKKANELFQDNVFDISALKNLENVADSNTYIVEYSDEDDYKQGSAFYLPNIGLITSYHVTEKGEFFKVYRADSYPDNPIGTIGKALNEIASDRAIDYAVYSVPTIEKTEHTILMGNSKNIKIGDQVTIIGYPNHDVGNSPYIQTCSITSRKKYMGALFYTVSGRIVHGASGGIVLNADNQVIGIIKGGIVDYNDDSVTADQGFVPLHLMLEHLEEAQASLPRKEQL